MIIEILAAHVSADVTSQTARVIVEAAPTSDVSWQRAIEVERTEVDGHVSKGATLDTPASARRMNNSGESGFGDGKKNVFLRNGLSIAREGIRRAIEQRGADRIVRIFGPIPISKEMISNGCGNEQYLLTADIPCSHTHYEEPVRTSR